jgi:uncharacterized protein (DUF427 family)
MQGGREPGPDHPITIEPAEQRVTVRVGDTILAESINAVVLCEGIYPPVLYIPREEVAIDELVPTDTTTHCPYKGDASYFGVRGGASDVACSYQDPFGRMDAIRGYLAFYPDRADGIETAPMR